MSVPDLQITVDYDNPRETVKEIAKIIRPQWCLEDIKLKDMTTGYTNQNLLVYVDGCQDGVFLRVITANIDGLLASYKKVSRFLHNEGLGPALEGIFTNGVCHQFVDGETFSWGTRYRVFEDDLSRKIAKSMAKFHTKEMLQKAEEANILECDQERIVRMCREMLSIPGIPESMKKLLPSASEWMAEFIRAEKMLENVGADRAFCHMDVNPTNCILTPDGQVVLIDYDQCIITYLQYDIALHFTTFLDLRNPVVKDYPSEEFRKKWLRHYLHYRREFDQDRTPVSDEDVEMLHTQVTVARLTVLLRGVFSGIYLEMILHKTGYIMSFSVASWELYLEQRDELAASLNIDVGLKG